MRGAKRLLFCDAPICRKPGEEDNVSLAGDCPPRILTKIKSQGMFSYVYAISAYRRFTRRWFKISQRGSTVRQEVVAGLKHFWRWSTRLSSFRACWVKQLPACGSFRCDLSGCRTRFYRMGLWANLPLAIGCAISLTALPHSVWCWGNILAYLSRWVPVPDGCAVYGHFCHGYP